VSLLPGFDNGNGEWDEYSSYVNTEGLEIGSPVRISHLFLFVHSVCLQCLTQYMFF